MFRWGRKSPAAPVTPAVDADRRAAARCRLETVAIVEWAVRPTHQGMRGRVYDISVSGVGLVSADPVPPGSRIALDWRFGPEEAHQTLLAWVVRAVPRPNGKWLLGCRFDA